MPRNKFVTLLITLVISIVSVTGFFYFNDKEIRELILLQNGYMFTKHTSHEEVIENSLEGYYLALKNA